MTPFKNLYSLLTAVAEETPARNPFPAGLSSCARGTGALTDLPGSLVERIAAAKESGFLFIDAKGDGDMYKKIVAITKEAGRKQDLFLLDFGNPDDSCGYNPMVEGDVDSIVSRLLKELSEESDDVAVRTHMAYVLGVLIKGAQTKEFVPTFAYLIALLKKTEGLLALEKVLASHPEVQALVAGYIQKYRKADGSIDDDLYAKEHDYLASRLGLLGDNGFQLIVNTAWPDIVVSDIVENNRMVYVRLSPEEQDASSALVRLLLDEVLSTASALPAENSGRKPFLIAANSDI